MHLCLNNGRHLDSYATDRNILQQKLTFRLLNRSQLIDSIKKLLRLLQKVTPTLRISRRTNHIKARKVVLQEKV